MKTKIILTLITLCISVFITGKKIPLDHKNYDHWKSFKNHSISNDGIWISYEINPQEGDGILYLKNVKNNSVLQFKRGYKAKFSPSGKYFVYKIKPEYKKTRKAKKDKKKKDALPKDNLAILILGKTTPRIIERVKNYKIPEKSGDWLVYHMEKPEKKDKKDEKTKNENKDKNKIKKKEDKSKNPGTDFIIENPIKQYKQSYKDVTKSTISKNGGLISFLQIKKVEKPMKKDKKEKKPEEKEKKKDKKKYINYSTVSVFHTREKKINKVFAQKGIVKHLSLEEKGQGLTFLFTAEQEKYKAKIFSLYYSSVKDIKAKIIAKTGNIGMVKGWSPSEFRKPEFSKDGNRVYFGTSITPVDNPEDKRLKEDKYHVDVWSWHDKILQPRQKKTIKKLKEKNYLTVYIINKKKIIQLSTPDMETVIIPKGKRPSFALGISIEPYRLQESWENSQYNNLFEVNLKTGKKKMVLKGDDTKSFISPSGKFIVWFNYDTQHWYSKESGKTIIYNLTKELKVSFNNVLHDKPSKANSYRMAGWTLKDRKVLIYDRYDIWAFDPKGKQKPENITKGFGRKNNITFRYQNLDRQKFYINTNKKIYLRAFHNYNKKSGYYYLSKVQDKDPVKLLFGDFSIYGLKKAENADTCLWTKSTFKELELFSSNINFKNPVQITNLAKQKEKYLWGTSELVSWYSFDNKKLQGLLYKPENFDPSKKYPMIVYFYERSSRGLHRFWTPSPSASIINRSLYASNGYLIFVPDIPYKEGYPGESSYDAIVSGTSAMLNKYKFIDRNRIGLNGQSWGGYQIAWLVTKTDLFACAFSGAPVSNMTSAYGGIRWGSGLSRMFQYEKTQSRIGGTLWEKPFHYIENSPIFFIPKINTPLLIMHNDNDGAVPWYQGIEYFVSLRRLQKPAWLLVYNKEAHNLRRRANKKDLAIRTMQFYDHYLKGANAPYWMDKGISQLEKGKKDGYELIKK